MENQPREIYVLVNKSGGFATGGGSSTKSHIRSYRTEAMANRMVNKVWDAIGYIRFIEDDEPPF